MHLIISPQLYTAWITSHNPLSEVVSYIRSMQMIAVKWEKSHYEVMGWVCARMAFAILRATNLCLRGSRVKWRNGHGMDDGAGLPHFPH